MATDDELLAGSLFYGNLQWDGWLRRRVFLSSRTRPTEDDARRALYRVLRRGRPPSHILVALAHAFHPNGAGAVKIMLKKRSKAHSDPDRDSSIAFLVHTLRSRGKSYRQAVAAVAKAINKNEKHIEKIYSKDLKDLTERYPLPVSDKASRAVTSRNKLL